MALSISSSEGTRPRSEEPKAAAILPGLAQPKAEAEAEAEQEGGLQ